MGESVRRSAEDTHNLAQAMAAFNRAMDIYQANTISQGSRLKPEEADELRVLGDIIQRAAARVQELRRQGASADEGPGLQTP
ncbi:hypothetical protein J4573_38670 [Actinomadura barringtoniae]|uniref:Uncharacterized protein n=1 Tax=Actinomadura barringtoniae TaxID=1427535 RepID=A0A939TE80_9ACTN|nr:hypothetical protein [Actinomadura barringtoniae]MBO2453070.1 hypothetical protein [Actinomadura barringtoniae]